MPLGTRVDEHVRSFCRVYGSLALVGCDLHLLSMIGAASLDAGESDVALAVLVPVL